MKILQIAPVIGPGTGVGAVAHHLEQEWRAAGHQVGRFTMDDARGSWLPEPGPGLRGKLALMARVVWFSTVGSVLAHRVLRRHPDAVALCHNDVLAGDVYVNHGILQAAMRSRGSYRLRMLRNPMHLFVAARDTLRYRSAIHRVVVNLVDEEDSALRATYPSLRPRTVTIGNGVDVERYRPPTAAGRAAARRHLGLADDDVALLFVGHEFERKGLPAVMHALCQLPSRFRLVVVGGAADMVEDAARAADHLGLSGRVILLGQVPDPREAFHACDVFTFPSAYESYGLVVLEALACGLPVVATPVGCVPEVVHDGVDGYVTSPAPEALARAVGDLAGLDRGALAAAARAVAEAHSWHEVSQSYLRLFESLRTSGMASATVSTSPAPRRTTKETA
ncbi:hypothetical protein ASE27_03130 [Oerskovia sp. Root918]|uniref:glycosyltransferase family 4 protein n=1 Tax=Oerskovia sp. Root918 TaxID=1736607 RepID=UPI0006FD2EF3|nr:glycosyltransferase family 4 protein [Oerskovia sp. Root918]KRD47357.1 hypothetical protein ASE27_03130 [Oerskovia sp. Root918]